MLSVVSLAGCASEPEFTISVDMLRLGLDSVDNLRLHIKGRGARSFTSSPARTYDGGDVSVSVSPDGEFTTAISGGRVRRDARRTDSGFRFVQQFHGGDGASEAVVFTGDVLRGVEPIADSPESYGSFPPDDGADFHVIVQCKVTVDCGQP